MDRFYDTVLFLVEGGFTMQDINEMLLWEFDVCVRRRGDWVKKRIRRRR